MVTIQIHHFVTLLTVFLTLTALILSSLAISGHIDYRDNSIPAESIIDASANGETYLTFVEPTTNAVVDEDDLGGLAARTTGGERNTESSDAGAGTRIASRTGDKTSLAYQGASSSEDLDVLAGMAERTSQAGNLAVRAEGMAFFGGELSTDNRVTIKPPASVTTSYSMILPPAIGTANQVLKLANTTTGELEFGDVTSLTLTTDNLGNGSNALDIEIPNTISLITTGGNAMDLTSSGTLLFDAVGDITLDAGGGDIFLKDGGTTFGALVQTGGELVVKSGSTPITAMTFAGANVTHSGDVTLSSTTADKPLLTLTTTDHTAGSSSEIRLQQNGTGANGDDIGQITFFSQDDGSNTAEVFCEILGEIRTATASEEAGKISMNIKTDGNATLVSGLTLTGSSTTNGQVEATIGAGASSTTAVAGLLTVAGNMTASADIQLNDGSVTITDNDNASSLSVTNNTITTADALVDISSSTISTGAMMRINANTATHDGEILELINAGDATSTGTGLSITMPSITTGAAKGIDIVMVGATTSAKGISITMDAITTGDMLYLDNGGGTMTGDGKFINCNDDDTSKFSVAANGLTTIAGSASGTDALVLTAGDILVTSGHIDMTVGDLTLADGSVSITDADNASSLSVTNNTISTADALVDISSTSIRTGAMMRINANAATHDGEILELINAGDATSTGTGLSITMPDITTGAAKGIDIVMVGATTTAKGISVTMDAITTGDMLYLDNGGGTMTGDGKFINCNDDDTSVFSVASGGLTTISGVLTQTGAITGASGGTTNWYSYGAGAISTSSAPGYEQATIAGVIISRILIDLTSLGVKGDAANDVIGLPAGGAAYIGKNVVSEMGLIYKAEVAILEAFGQGTATITNDIDIAFNSSAALAYDGAAGTAEINLGLAGGTAGSSNTYHISIPTADDYIYLVEGDTAATTGVYNAGKLLITFYGHATF